MAAHENTLFGLGDEITNIQKLYFFILDTYCERNNVGNNRQDYM